MGMIYACLYLFEVYCINSVYFFPKCQKEIVALKTVIAVATI